MAYSLGIDVGTTFTAAAIWRDGQVEVVALETHGVTVPSVVWAKGDDVVFGSVALRRMASDPAGGAREFKRRLGDPVPVLLSGAPYSADRLVAMFARWVIESVTQQFGERPQNIVLTHPANWTQFQLHLFTTSVRQAGLEDVVLLSEPQAAAHDFGAAAHTSPGELIVVYDLGGGTFDVALLRCAADGFEHVGEAAGVERLGGIDFDEAVFQHVVRNIPREVVASSREEPAGRMALAQLRRTCVEAKESLSSEVAVDVPVMLPGHTATVRLTRPEFEQMIAPMLGQTVDLVRQVLSRAELQPEDLSAILLVGGSSRIPLVADLVGREIGATVRVDAHPKLVVARGAARWAGSRPAPLATAEPRGSRRGVLLAGAAVLGLAVIGGGVALVASGGDGEGVSETSVAGATTGNTLNTAPSTSAGQTSPATAATSTTSTTTSTTTTTTPPVTGPRISGASVLGRLEFPATELAGDKPFGGLSGLDFDASDGTLLALSDNAPPASGSPAVPAPIEDSFLYGLRLDLGDDRLDPGDIELLSTTSLLGPDGSPFVRQDGEGVAVTDDGSVFAAIEGSAPTTATPPLLRVFNADGSFNRLVDLPAWYDPTATTGILPELGGFASLTLVDGEQPLLLGGFDYSLQQDLDGVSEVTDPRSVRLFTVDPATDTIVAEYGYPLDPRPALIDGVVDEGKQPGIFDLAAVDDAGTVVAAEYVFEEDGQHLVLHEFNLRAATPTEPSEATPPNLEKTRIIDLADLGIGLVTFQGMTRGPDLPDGRPTLILASDNEFGGTDGTRATTFVVLALELT